MFRIFKLALAVTLTVAGSFAFSSASAAQDACPGCAGSANPALLQFLSPPNLPGGGACDVRHIYKVDSGKCVLAEGETAPVCSQFRPCDVSFRIKCAGPNCVDANGTPTTISGLILRTPNGDIPVLTGGCNQTFPLGQLPCGALPVTLCSAVAYPTTPGFPISMLRCTQVTCAPCQDV